MERHRLEYELVYFYPPAQTLRLATESDLLADSLSSQSMSSHSRSLYLHLPFCTGKCAYCHYVTFNRQSSEAVDSYLRLLRMELRSVADRILGEEADVSCIHVGGGTPTYLASQQIRGLMSFLRQVVNISQGAEITWESSPETILETGDSKIAALLESGVNRLNIGIQAFQDNLLRVLGRRHSAKEAAQAIKLARTGGFQNINVDLMFGLPDQTMTDWLQTLATVGELKPESVTVYQLRIKQRTAISRVPFSRLPHQDACLEMASAALEALQRFGHTPVQPNQFVLHRRFSHRYVEEKWERPGEVVGVGVSAYSFVRDWFYFNATSLAEYRALVESNRLPIALGRRLSEAQQMAKFMVLGIKMLPGGVSKEAFRNRFGRTVDEQFGSALRKLDAAGLIRSDAERVILTPPGILFADEVCVEFYAEEDKERLRAAGASRYGSYLVPPVSVPAASREP